MNRRNLVLTVLIVLIAAFAVQIAAAQSTEVPQGIVNVVRTVLRDAPTQGGGYIGALQEGTQVALLDVAENGLWLEVGTADGLQGWAHATHFTPIDRAQSIRPAVLFEAPGDSINYVTQVDNTETLFVMDVDDSGEWVQVTAPDGSSGWLEAVELRYDYGVSLQPGQVLYNWPSSEDARVAAIIESPGPVIVRENYNGWVRVDTMTGESGWAPVTTFALSAEIGEGFMDLEEGENANIRVEPTIDSPAITVVFTNDAVLAAGRNSTGRWLLVATPDGRAGWVSSGLVQLQTTFVNNLPILAP